MTRRQIGWTMFIIALLLMHYHSTIHFVWSLLGIPYEFPLDPTEGWWALLKGFLPAGALWIIFFAGLITKHKTVQ